MELFSGFIKCNESPFDDEEAWNKSQEEKMKEILEDPREIYKFLKTRVYKQDEAVKQASMLLYNHAHGRVSRNLFCGPSGCGKTYIFDVIKNELFPYTIIANSAVFTQTGFSGAEKPCSPLFSIDTKVSKGYIMVYDEFDKFVTPKVESHGNNISATMQSELLALVQPSQPYIMLRHNSSDSGMRVRIDNISWVFTGSFSAKANEIAKNKSTNAVGFGTQTREYSAFEEKLTLDDIINFGLIQELASRIGSITNLRPLQIEDYMYLISEFENSTIKQIEKKYLLPKEFIRREVLSDDELKQIAENAYESSLGVRAAYSQIQQRLDDYIFDNFENFTPSF